MQQNFTGEGKMKTKIKDFEMYYEISGKSNGSWLVLLHGMAGSTRSWKYQIDDFNKHFRVLNLDLVGNGSSTSSQCEYYDPAVVANHVRLLMDQLGVMKAHILGISLGTMIQQLFCEIFPEKVISTVYVSPVTKPNSMTRFVNGFMGKVLLKIFPKNLILFIMAQTMLSGKIHQKSRAFFLQETMKMNDAEFKKWCAMILHTDVFYRIHPSELPALIATGEQDVFYFDDAVLLQKKYPNCRFEVIHDAGHVFIFQKPQEFNRIAIDFMLGIQSQVSLTHVHTQEIAG
jgi:pimeloyl-ACP methyl ester carboxylesterase